MKSLLILLLVAGVANGQIDSAKVGYHQLLIGGLLTTISSGTITTAAEQPTVDTIPIVYLFCVTDTTGDFTYHDQELRTTYWAFGYDVREHRLWVDKPGSYCSNCPATTLHHITYLDRNKKPLGKNIIVWQTKSIQQ